jgi:hypothetical protein
MLYQFYCFIVTDVLKECDTFIFSIKQSKENGMKCLTLVTKKLQSFQIVYQLTWFNITNT